MAKAIPTKISIIIPVLNESSCITQTLARLETAVNIEVIVVDGGSTDTTLEIVQNYPVKTFPLLVLSTSPGRAGQMNWGTKAATGEILLFLHGDTQLPQGFDAKIRQILMHPGTIAGAFALTIDLNQPGMRLIEFLVNLRSRFLQLPYGDQAIFMTKQTFEASGGFPSMPIMEDFELICQLRQQGRVALIPDPVLTSGRRWQKLGIFKTTVINQLIILGYRLGISPQQLVLWYRRAN